MKALQGYLCSGENKLNKHPRTGVLPPGVMHAERALRPLLYPNWPLRVYSNWPLKVYPNWPLEECTRTGHLTDVLCTGVLPPGVVHAERALRCRCRGPERALVRMRRCPRPGNPSTFNPTPQTLSLNFKS